MRLLSWNINGIRSSKELLEKVLNDLNSDIICLQETKVTKSMLDERCCIVNGYSSYFSFSNGRSGYSGVATFVKDEYRPWKSEEGLSGKCKTSSNLNSYDFIGDYGNFEDFTDEELLSLDNEGRCIMTEHKIKTENGQEKNIVVINVYCPRADKDNNERLGFKLRFYKLLEIRAKEILASGRSVIIVGDINTCHKKIDHCNPNNDAEFLSDPGRQWLDHFLIKLDNQGKMLESTNKSKFIDTFRIFNPVTTNVYTNWSSSTGARATNYGQRIDYIFADHNLAYDVISDCQVLPYVMGSDHCPVYSILNCKSIPTLKCPLNCTKYYPQFFGKQQTLLDSLASKRFKFDLSSSDSSQSPLLTVSQVNSKASCSYNSIESNKRNINNNKCTNKNSKKSNTKISNYFSKPAMDSKTNSENEQRKLENILNNKNNITYSDTLRPEKLLSILNDDQDIENNENVSNQNESEDNNIPKINKSENVNTWQKLLKGPPQPPNCKGHKELCVLRTVKKPGSNQGRQFWVCNRPEGHKFNKEARCDHFVWLPK